MPDHLAKYEARPAKFSPAETERRMAEYRNAYAMARMEGAPHDAVALRLLALLASGRIPEAVYLRLARESV